MNDTVKKWAMPAIGAALLVISGLPYGPTSTGHLPRVLSGQEFKRKLPAHLTEAWLKNAGDAAGGCNAETPKADAPKADAPKARRRLPVNRNEDGTISILFGEVGSTTVCLTGTTSGGAGDPVELTVEVLPLQNAWFAAAGVLLLLLFLPYALGETWTTLLSENSAPSPGRVQFVVWLLPTLIVYAVLSIPLHQFADVGQTLPIILGLGGATTVLGAQGTPKPNAGVRGSGISALLKDANGKSDLASIQLLIVSLVGAATLLASFSSTLQVPNLPPYVIALFGASQATFAASTATK